MNTQVCYMIASQRAAELRRAAERAQLTSEVTVRRRSLRDRARVTRPTVPSGTRDVTALEVERAGEGA